MSIQIVEIAQPSVIDTVAVAQPSTVAVVEVRQGPAGADGPAVINAATTSDGTADLLLSNVETATAEVTGTLIAPHIHGNLAGSVYAHVRAGEALEKGDPVYISSSHGSGATLIAEVSKADASNAAKMPAVGIMDEDVALHANGHMVITGTITELNTAAYSINAELYVAAGGGLTATPPTARAQPVARVERANANNGAILVKVNGLSASDATPSTLVRRNASGGASFAGINTNSGSYSQVGGVNFNVAVITAANLTTTGSGTVTVSGAGGTTISGGPLLISLTGNVSEQRNGIGQPQAFRLYNTYSSSTNFERLNFRWDSNVAKIGTEKGSASPGGTARDLVLETNGTERVRVTAAGAVTASGAVSGVSGAFGNWTLGADILATTPGGSVQVSGVGSFRFGGTGERIYNSGSAIKIRNAANNADAPLTCSNLTASGTVQTGGYTFATLPTPATGMRAYITDGASSPVYMANAAGGGSTVTPVFYDGTNWINA